MIFCVGCRVKKTICGCIWRFKAIIHQLYEVVHIAHRPMHTLPVPQMYRLKHTVPLFWVLLLCVQQRLVAQITNVCTDNTYGLAGFFTPITAGCVPLTLNVANTAQGATNVRYVFDYKGGSPSAYTPVSDSSAAFKYLKAGSYVVLQLAERDGKKLRECRTITVRDTLPPVFSLSTCGDGSVKLTVPKSANNTYDTYGINWNFGGAENVEVISKIAPFSQTYVYQNVMPKVVEVQGIYRIGQCGGRARRVVVPKIATQKPRLEQITTTSSLTAEIVIDNPDEIELLLLRKVGAGVFESTGSITRIENRKIRVLIDSTDLACFKVQPTDSCVVGFESNVICNAVLSVDQRETTNDLAWATAPEMVPTKTTVLLDQNDWLVTSEQNKTTATDQDPSCGSSSCYRVRIETPTGTVVSNEVCVLPPPLLCNTLGSMYVPTVFSPNGDGTNDVFQIKGTGLNKTFKMAIFNSWGVPVFSTALRAQVWDGRLEGQPAPTGTYFYTIEAQNQTGQTFRKNGYFILIR